MVHLLRLGEAGGLDSPVGEIKDATYSYWCRWWARERVLFHGQVLLLLPDLVIEVRLMETIPTDFGKNGSPVKL